MFRTRARRLPDRPSCRRPSLGWRRSACTVMPVLLWACGSVGLGPERKGAEGGPAPELRLGYLPNLTHAPALVAIEYGLLEKELGKSAKLNLKSFNAGPSVVEALFADAVDASYIGPGPAINAYLRSRGEAIRIISGATEGGAALVVQPSVDGPEDLRGKKVASPHLGNTQDIALRTWLASKGLSTTLQGGGEVSVVPQDNAQTLDTFRLGEIAGAWLPEPWTSRLVEEAGAKVLVDEKTLWPAGRFPTTVLVVRTDFLQRNPDVVERLLKGHIAAIQLLNDRPESSLDAANRILAKETGKALPPKILSAASPNLSFTTEVLPQAFKALAAQAKALGLVKKADLEGAVRLDLLNKLRVSPNASAGPNGDQKRRSGKDLGSQTP